MPRTTFDQLPSIAELEITLATETQLSIPPGKQDAHFVSVEPLIEFLKVLEIDIGEEISLDKTWQEVRNISEEIIYLAKEKLLTDGKKFENESRKLYRYLAESDVPKESDLIVTFGAKTETRVRKVVELFKKGLAPKIWFCGGSPLYAQGQSEAERYKQIAIELGVPEEVIVTESQSITLADNVRSSLKLLREEKTPHKRVILVNSPYSQRRGWSHWMKYAEMEDTVYRVNCETKEGLREDDWFLNEQGIFYVMGEYYKLWFGLVINTN